MEATLFYEIPCRLGEGIMWHEQRQQLFWVNIIAGHLHNLDPVTMVHRSWQLESKIGTIVPDLFGQLVMGMQGYIARFNPETGESMRLIDLPEKVDNRSNDGKCDPAGRFWLGTMNLEKQPHAANLFCILPDLTIQKKISDTTISNGIVWTKDWKTMYFIDSPTRCVQQFNFDFETGEIEFVKKAIEIPEKLGSPDGMTIDENDQLWIAHHRGSGIFHWDPVNGKLIEKVELPVPNPTSCWFGGEDRKTLYITTAWDGLSEEERKKFPLSGSLFSIETEVRGILPYPFKG